MLREAATKNMSREAIVKQLLETAAWDIPREAARWNVWRETATKNMSREAVVKQL